MELTILLSKVFGIYFILIGVVMFMRRKQFKALTHGFVDEPMMRFLFGAFMLAAGLFIVVSHQDWSTTPAIFISVLGWLTVLKGLLYMTLSNGGVKKWVQWLWIKGHYGIWGSIFSIVLGLYLTNFGFGWY